MSGGHFHYQQHRIEDIAVEIDRLIASNKDETLNQYGDKRGNGYPPEIIERFLETAHTLRQAAEMAQRVDWLVSGDDGQHSFMLRWEKLVDEGNQTARNAPTTPDRARISQNDVKPMKILDKNIKQTVSVSAAGCLKWSRRLPRKTGFYWIRSHEGIGTVAWFIAPCLVARFYDGAEVLLTRNFRSMQQIEFYPGQIVPPN